MLKTIIDNLTKRVEALEEHYVNHQTVLEIYSEQIEQLLNKCVDLQAIINTLHAVSEEPFVLKKPGRPRVSHCIGKSISGI